MDAISGTSLNATAQTSDKQTFGAQVVSATIDRMNTNQSGQKNSDYDFQTKVLSGMGIGKNLDVSI